MRKIILFGLVFLFLMSFVSATIIEEFTFEDDNFTGWNITRQCTGTTYPLAISTTFKYAGTKGLDFGSAYGSEYCGTGLFSEKIYYDIELTPGEYNISVFTQNTAKDEYRTILNTSLYIDSNLAMVISGQNTAWTELNSTFEVTSTKTYRFLIDFKTNFLSTLNSGSHYYAIDNFVLTKLQTPAQITATDIYTGEQINNFSVDVPLNYNISDYGTVVGNVKINETDKSFNFNATSNTRIEGFNPGFNYSDSFTISAWFMFYDIPLNSGKGVITRGNLNGGQGISIERTPTFYRINIGVRITSFSDLYRITSEPYTLYNIIISYSNGTQKIYINGSLSDTKTITEGTLTNENYRIGTSDVLSGNPGLGFNGTIYQTLIFNRNVSDEEATTIYNAGKDAYSPITDGLIMQYTAKDYLGTPESPTRIYNTKTYPEKVNNTFSTTNGTIPWELNEEIINITFNTSDYFNMTYLNQNVSNGIAGELYQAVLSLSATDYLQSVLYPHTATIGLKTQSSSDINTYYLHPGTYTIKGFATGFGYNSSKTFTINQFEELSETLYFGSRQLNITVRDYFSNQIVSNYSANLLSEGITIPITTNTGHVTSSFNTGIIDIEILPLTEEYAVASEEVYLGENSQNHTIFLIPQNSILVSIFSNLDYQLINTDIEYSLDAVNLNVFMSGNTTNGTIFFDELPSDQYVLTLSGGSLYPQQIYFITLSAGEGRKINTYLTPINLVSSTVITLINPRDQKIEGATITMQQTISGAQVTVSQQLTDSTGRARFYLKSDQTYTAIISADGYQPRTAIITPTSLAYEVTLRIDPIIRYVYNVSTTGIYYKINPEIYLLNQEIYNFNITVQNPDGELSWFYVKSGETISNITSSPAGGIANINLDLSTYSGALTVEYGFKKTGEEVFTRNVIYIVDNLQYKNVTLYQGTADLTSEIPTVWKGLIILISIIIALFICFELGFPAEAYGFIITGITVFFALPIIAWINPIFPIVIGILTILGAYSSITQKGGL